MLSPFGKLVRTKRNEKGLLLKDLADYLGISDSYLSAVEFGRRAVPSQWVTKLTKRLSLTPEETEELTRQADLSQTSIRLDFSGRRPTVWKEVALQFSRMVESMTKDELEALRRHLLEFRYDEHHWKQSKR